MNQPIKYHGGKYYLAKKFIALFPKHLHYVEPYAGGLAVLLKKDPNGISEVVNDISWDLTNFWKVLQGTASFKAFRTLCEATPFSQREWNEADYSLKNYPIPDTHEPEIHRAWRFFIRSRMSLSGRDKSFSAVTKTRVRRGMNNEVSAWLSAVDGLPEVHDRLRRVMILDALDGAEVIKAHDTRKTLFYCDPTYLPETRTAKLVYAHEMTEAQHEELIHAVKKCCGKVAISGYRSKMYDTYLASWTRHDFRIANHAASGKEKKTMTECLWCNF